jgi:hypothetical protein
MDHLQEMLLILVAAGVMGAFGQGVRAAVGLKGMTDEAKSLNLSPSDLFQTARLLTSLMIGTLVGFAAGLTYIQAGGTAQSVTIQTLLGFAASGYLGTDVLEAFITKYFTPATPAATNAIAARNATLVASVAASKLAAPAPAAAPIPATAKELVYSVMNELLPGVKIADTTALASIGYDSSPTKDIIRGTIDARNWHNVVLGFGALDGCSNIADITAIVQKKEGA